MKAPVALLARILTATSLTICLAATAGAQHGGGGHAGGGGGHAGGGGSHGGSMGGGHVGGGHFGGGGRGGPGGAGAGFRGGGMAGPGMHAPGGSMPASAIEPANAVPAGSVSPAWSQPIYTPADAPAAHTRFAAGNLVWQEPPATHAAVYPTHVTVAANAWRSAAPARPSVTSSRFARMPSPVLGRQRPDPRSLLTPPVVLRPHSPLFRPPILGLQPIPSRTFGPGFFGCSGDFDCDGDFDGFFPIGFLPSPFFSPNPFFFGGFFNGFSCFSGFGFSPCWFSPFGFWPGWGWGWDSGPGAFGDGTGNYGISGTPSEPSGNTAPSTEMGPFSSENTPEESQQSNAAAMPAPLTILYFNDGSSYGVTDYWLVNGRLHYITSYGGENEIDFNQLDLQRTVDENDRRGVPFTLRSVAPPPAPNSAPAPPSEPIPLQ